MCMELKVKKSGRGLFVYLPKGAGYSEGDTIEIPQKETDTKQTHKTHLTEERVIELIAEHGARIARKEIEKASGGY